MHKSSFTLSDITSVYIYIHTDFLCCTKAGMQTSELTLKAHPLVPLLYLLSLTLPCRHLLLPPRAPPPFPLSPHTFLRYVVIWVCCLARFRITALLSDLSFSPGSAGFTQFDPAGQIVYSSHTYKQAL